MRRTLCPEHRKTGEVVIFEGGSIELKERLVWPIVRGGGVRVGAAAHGVPVIVG